MVVVGEMDLPYSFLLQLWGRDSMVASQVGCIIGNTLLRVPNTWGSPLECFHVQESVLGEGKPPPTHTHAHTL